MNNAQTKLPSDEIQFLFRDKSIVFTTWS